METITETKSNTYPPQSEWGVHYKLNKAYNKLQYLLPDAGKVENLEKNRKLEKFRKASNLLYDLFNNGLCNHRKEFGLFFKVPMASIPRYGLFLESDWPRIERIMEPFMSKIIMEAWMEQFPSRVTEVIDL